MKYLVATAKGPFGEMSVAEEFEESVKELLDNGFTPYGDPQVVVQQLDCLFFQAFIKE